MSHITHADLGGQPGYGRVVPEPVGELFHAAWEPRALAITLAMGATGAWNLDTTRAVRESLPDYADLGYYQIWIAALETLLAERGLVEPGEIEAGRALGPAVPVARVLHATDVATALASGTPTARSPTRPASFALGQRVRTRSEAVAHHTRLPAYARGHCGLIERIHGMHVFADRHAHGQGEQPQWLYTVVFDAAELWPGQASSPHPQVSIDAWEPYLEPA